MSEAFYTILGVIIGTFIPWLKEWLREKQQRDKHAKYLAAQLICILDEYVEKCCDVVGDDGSAYGAPSSPDGSYSPQVKTPKLNYPDEIDWKSIRGSLMYELLSLPNNARKTDRYISGWSEHASPPDFDELFEARWEGYANLGLRAIKLKEALRKEYKLPDENFNLNPDWNSQKYLEDKIKEIEIRQAKLAKHIEQNTVLNE